ncbi:MAG: hypothetical protein KatS3mg110_4686 [Pirellulaceae bacterium]|nr:MAG: hypothetical protein KatS3mg110_1342 [Pirellulaceae bacterium]GIW95569.1 MAG: hypothetical protein KatS3mg110_3610 [Pirellulaceae bacterium]GIW96645.1 MAG: hypothetical protein KatS3mg110_4686 [Pirellulaceae bacterium]
MRWASVIRVVAVVLVISVLASALSILFFGHVEGTEFSPEALMRRDFAYYVEPITGAQISPVVRTSYVGQVEQQLILQRWVQSQPARRWHLVRGRYGVRVAGPQPAALLCDALDMSGSSGKPFWLGWNEQHPAKASLLWPVVFVLARHGWYELIPELLEVARGASAAGPAEFRIALRQAVDRQVQQLWPRLDAADSQVLREALGELSVVWEQPVGDGPETGN